MPIAEEFPGARQGRFRDPDTVLAPLAEIGVSTLPGAGEAMALRDAFQASGRGTKALRKGEFQKAAKEGMDFLSSMAAAIPGAGLAVRLARKGAKLPQAKEVEKLVKASFRATQRFGDETFAQAGEKLARNTDELLDLRQEADRLKRLNMLDTQEGRVAQQRMHELANETRNLRRALNKRFKEAESRPASFQGPMSRRGAQRDESGKVIEFQSRRGETPEARRARQNEQVQRGPREITIQKRGGRSEQVSIPELIRRFKISKSRQSDNPENIRAIDDAIRRLSSDVPELRQAFPELFR